MDKLQKEFGKDVAFLFIYTKEAHPDDGPDDRRKADDNGGWKIRNNKIKINQHKEYKDRVKAAKGLKKAGKQKWRVVIDDMKNGIQNSWGRLPNSAFLIDPTGRIHGKWSWVRESTDAIRETLKGEESIKPYTVADDPELPLRATNEGEWIEYKIGKKKVKVTFDAAEKSSVSRTTGEEKTTTEFKKLELKEKRAKPTIKKLKVGKLKIECVVVTEGTTETWYSTRLPGDGVAQVIEDGKVVRKVTDAGFLKDKSCLAEYDPTGGD